MCERDYYSVGAGKIHSLCSGLSLPNLVLFTAMSRNEQPRVRKSQRPLLRTLIQYRIDKLLRGMRIRGGLVLRSSNRGRGNREVGYVILAIPRTVVLVLKLSRGIAPGPRDQSGATSKFRCSRNSQFAEGTARNVGRPLMR